MSSTSKQSPGPFELRENGGIFGWSKALIDSDGNILLVYFRSGYDDIISIHDADWHLFAAAPEMLEALERMMANAIYDIELDKYTIEMSGFVANANKLVIAKAKGEQP